MFSFVFSKSDGSTYALNAENDGGKLTDSPEFKAQIAQIMQAAQSELNLNGLRAESYLQGRGITLNAAIAEGCGLVLNVGFENLAENKPFRWHNRQALIFPKYHFDAKGEPYLSGVKWRYTDNAKFKVGSYGKQGLFGWQSLCVDAPCFITEGEFDYLTLKILGFNAVCLGGTGGRGVLLEYLRAHKSDVKATLIMAFDCDKGENGENAGAKAENDLMASLKTTEFDGVKVLNASFLNDANATDIQKALADLGIKDLNDLAQKHQHELIEKRALFLCDLCQKTENLILHDLPSELTESTDAKRKDKGSVLAEWQIISAADFKDERIRRYFELANAPLYLTPFEELNKIHGGGLKPKELYVLGAASSFGKTDFVLQIAECVAQNAPVVFLNLEIPTEQCIARILSRRSFLGVDGEKNGRPIYWFTDASARVKEPMLDENEWREKLFADFENGVGKNLFFVEGDFGRACVEQLDNYLTRFCESHAAPLVIVDYLQILTCENFLDGRASDKQVVDGVLQGLKHIANAHAVPLLLVSSFSRANYEKPAGLDAFKESGIIEYTADNAWILDVGCPLSMSVKEYIREKLNEKKPKVTAATIRADLMADFEKYKLEKRRRILEMRVPKNRNGVAGQSLQLFYDSQKHTFFENDPEWDNQNVE